MVIVFGNGRAKRLVDGLHPVTQDVLKPDEQREFQAARLGLLDHVGQIHRHAAVLLRHGYDVPRLVDVVILRAPAMNVVQIARRLDVPRRRRVG